jgi:hypothetical protein
LKQRKERRLSPSAQGRIIMRDKAPNGKVSDFLNTLDKALSAGEVEHGHMEVVKIITPGSTALMGAM